MKLTNAQCLSAKPKKQPYKMADGGGLYLLIHPNGSKYWRLRYRVYGREKLMALGVYPLMTLAGARDGRDKAKKLLASDTDPMAHKKERKRQAQVNAANTFEAVAREWHGKQAERWAEKTGSKILRYLEKDIFPHVGSRPIADIDPPELLAALREIEGRGAYYNAGRLKQIYPNRSSPIPS